MGNQLADCCQQVLKVDQQDLQPQSSVSLLLQQQAKHLQAFKEHKVDAQLVMDFLSATDSRFFDQPIPSDSRTRTISQTAISATAASSDSKSANPYSVELSDTDATLTHDAIFGRAHTEREYNRKRTT